MPPPPATRLPHQKPPLPRRAAPGSTRALRTLALLALSTAFTLPAWATDTFGSLVWQNDVFIGQDGGGYTNGLFLSQLRVASPGEDNIEPPMIMWPLVSALGLPRPTLTALSLGQMMVTPRDITRSTPDSTDAPYIGALLVRSTYVTVQGPNVHMLVLNVGVIGPASGAKETQRFIHKVTGSTEPEGWDTQVSNRGLLGLEGSSGWRAAWRGKSDGSSRGAGADAIALADAALGNLQRSAGTTLMLRYGHGLDRSYATTPRILSQRGDPMLLDEGWFSFTAFLTPKETQHGPIHGRLPVRQRPNCGVGTPIPGRPLSLSRLPQASWGPFSRFRGVPSGCGDDRWRNTRLRRAVFLPPLRLVRFLTHRRRNRSEPGIPGCP
jgi:lipid A 3-O-deacylase